MVFLGQLNRAPEFTSVPRLETIVGKPYVYLAKAQDPDGDPVRFGGGLMPAEASLDPATGLFSWLPTVMGMFEVQLKASDDRRGAAEQRFNVLVTHAPSNRPPVFVTTPTTVARVARGDSPSNPGFAYQAVAEDSDGDLVSYRLISGPSGFRIDPASGRMDWSPSEEHIGEASVSVEADDGRGGLARQEFRLCVLSSELLPADTDSVRLVAPTGPVGLCGCRTPGRPRARTVCRQSRFRGSAGVTTELNQVPAFVTEPPTAAIPWARRSSIRPGRQTRV